jgi:hypothetical protein
MRSEEVQKSHITLVQESPAIHVHIFPGELETLRVSEGEAHMDPLGMIIAVVLGIMLIGGFAQASSSPPEPKIVYVVERSKESKAEEQSNSSGGLILFLLIIGLAIYFLN